MKTSLFAIAIFLFCQAFYAQNDTLQEQILKMGPSKTILISNGRVLLMEKFLEGDIAKVKEIKDYLLSLENENYQALYPGEKWLILFWTKEYQPILDDIRDYKNVLRPIKNKVEPPDDNLFERLRAKSYNHKADLFQYIENVSLTDEQKEILIMHLTLGLKKDAETPDITQEQLNDRADWFLKTYPNSYAVDYTREYIRYKWMESNWGWGVEFFTGCGILTDKLRNSFSDNVALGAEFALSYKNFNLYQRDYIGIGETKKDIGLWWKHAEADLFVIEFALGYTALETNKIKMAPFAGIAGCDISPSQQDMDKTPGLSKYELDFSTTYTIGVNFDVKLGKPYLPMISYYGRENSYWFLRFRYEYVMPQFARSYPGYDGHMHCITIGIGGFGRKLTRQK